MTSIERNFNGVLHQVTVKQEERRMRMVEGEEELAILQEPRVTEISLEETAPYSQNLEMLVNNLADLVNHFAADNTAD